MNEMLDKAERAIRTHRHNTTEVQARECIRAIRPLTPEIIEARYPTDIDIWKSIIDAILEGR